MNRVLLVCAVLCLPHLAHSQDIDWPEETCPTEPELIQNGGFQFKEGLPWGSNLEAIIAEDVCYWQTNGRPSGGTVNRNARLGNLTDIIGDDGQPLKYARMYHAVHLADPQWRDPSYLMQYFPEPLTPGEYSISVDLKAQSNNLYGYVIGLSATPLATDWPLTSIYGNPFHYTDPAQLLPLLDQVVYMSESNEVTTDWTPYETTFEVTEPGLHYIYIFPISHGDFSGIKEKIVKSLYADNVSLDYLGPGGNACLIVPTKAAPQPVIISEGDGIPQPVGAGEPIALEYVVDNPGIDTSIFDDGIYIQRFGNGNFDMVSLAGNETFTDDEVFAMFEFVNVLAVEITQFSGGHTWVTYTCAKPCDLQADYDHDGDVDVADLLVLSADFGCLGGPDECEADLNGDGLTNVADWLIFNTEFGLSCDDAQPVTPVKRARRQATAR